MTQQYDMARACADVAYRIPRPIDLGAITQPLHGGDEAPRENAFLPRHARDGHHLGEERLGDLVRGAGAGPGRDVRAAPLAHAVSTLSTAAATVSSSSSEITSGGKRRNTVLPAGSANTPSSISARRQGVTR